jgi:hypothetical protein
LPDFIRSCPASALPKVCLTFWPNSATMKGTRSAISPDTRACDHGRCCARLDQLGQSWVRHPHGAGAVRLNHSRRDLARSIGVCPAFPSHSLESGGGGFLTVSTSIPGRRRLGIRHRTRQRRRYSRSRRDRECAPPSLCRGGLRAGRGEPWGLWGYTDPTAIFGWPRAAARGRSSSSESE